MSRAKRIGVGKYLYKGYEITNHGYYPPDRCNWWEAVNIKTRCADFHDHTKNSLMSLIDIYSVSESIQYSK